MSSAVYHNTSQQATYRTNLSRRYVIAELKLRSLLIIHMAVNVGAVQPYSFVPGFHEWLCQMYGGAMHLLVRLCYLSIFSTLIQLVSSGAPA